MFAQPGAAPTQGQGIDQQALKDLVDRAQAALQALEFYSGGDNRRYS